MISMKWSRNCFNSGEMLTTIVDLVSSVIIISLIIISLIING